MEISKVASKMAEDIVQAYLEHDRKDYAKASLYFAKVFRHLFPKLSEERIRRAGYAYVNALKHHDVIEEEKLSIYEQLENASWSKVRSSLLNMCKALDLPEEYATETTEFFRYHGIGDLQFALHTLKADMLFTTAIIGNENHSLILGGLYLACVRCHDMHNEYGIKLGKELISIYYRILLENLPK